MFILMKKMIELLDLLSGLRALPSVLTPTVPPLQRAKCPSQVPLLNASTIALPSKMLVSQKTIF